MTSIDFATYENMCLRCCQGNMEEKTSYENTLYEFIKTKSMVPQILEIIAKSKSEQTQFITVEIVNKVYLSSSKIGVLEFSFVNTKEEYDPHFDININFVKTYVGLLNENGLSMPNYLVNSIANYIGNTTRMYWLDIKNKKAYLEDIASPFFNDGVPIQKMIVGLKIFEYIMSNLFINSQFIGYLKFRRITVSFQEQGVNFIFKTTKKAIMFILDYLRQNGPKDQAYLTNAFKVFFHCLTFPFAYNYYNFSNIIELDEISTSIYPEEWAPEFEDQALFEGIFAVIETKEFSKETKHHAIKVLSNIASTRQYIFEEEIKQTVFRGLIVRGLVISVNGLNLDDEDYLVELIDYALRLMNVHGNRKIYKDPAMFNSWIQSCSHLSKYVVKNCYKLDDPSFNRFCDLWKRIYRQRVDDYNLNDTIGEYLKTYCRTNFQGPHTCNIFEDLSYKNYKKFKKLVKARFDSMSEFFNTKLKENLNEILVSAQQIYNDFENLSSLHANGQLNSQRNVVEQFLTKFSHFILFGCNT